MYSTARGANSVRNDVASPVQSTACLPPSWAVVRPGLLLFSSILHRTSWAWGVVLCFLAQTRAQCQPSKTDGLQTNRGPTNQRTHLSRQRVAGGLAAVETSIMDPCTGTDRLVDSLRVIMRGWLLSLLSADWSGWRTCTLTVCSPLDSLVASGQQSSTASSCRGSGRDWSRNGEAHGCSRRGRHMKKRASQKLRSTAQHSTAQHCKVPTCPGRHGTVPPRLRCDKRPTRNITPNQTTQP